VPVSQIDGRGQGFPDEFVVGVRTVDLGGVDEGDATVDRGVQPADHLGGVGSAAIAGGHARAAETDRGDVQVGPESALMQEVLLGDEVVGGFAEPGDWVRW